MKLIVFASGVDFKPALMKNAAATYCLARIPEQSWEKSLRDEIKRLYDLQPASGVERILVGGHAEPCFGLTHVSFFLEKSCAAESRELDNLCGSTTSVVVAFHRLESSRLYNRLEKFFEAAEKNTEAISSQELQALEFAFEHTLSDTIVSFLAGWRHALHNQLNLIKGYYELQSLGIGIPTYDVPQIMQNALKVCTDAKKAFKERGLPDEVGYLLDDAIKDLNNATLTPGGDFLEWHQKFFKAISIAHNSLLGPGGHDDKA